MTHAAPIAILKADDLAATIAWYVDVGFTVRDATAEGERRFAELEWNGVVLQFVSGETPWPGPPGLTGCFYLHPPSVDRVFAEINGRIDCPWGVEVRPWGTRELTLRDPNGYHITFTEAT